MGSLPLSIDTQALGYITKEIEKVKNGSRNLHSSGRRKYFRGRTAGDKGISDDADYMGMLATVINALALQDFLENEGIPTEYKPLLKCGQ